MKIEELLKYCQVCDSETIARHNGKFTGYCCTNKNCKCYRDYYAAIEDDKSICINDCSNNSKYTIFIEKDICKYYLFLGNEKIYFDSIDSLIEGYVSYRKNKIFQ